MKTSLPMRQHPDVCRMFLGSPLFFVRLFRSFFLIGLHSALDLLWTSAKDPRSTGLQLVGKLSAQTVMNWSNHNYETHRYPLD